MHTITLKTTIMKKILILSALIIGGLNVFGQNVKLTNGGFEEGSLIKGTKKVVGNDWFWQADQSKVPESNIELSSEVKNSGKTSLKMTATGDIVARYNVSIAKSLGVIPSLKYTLMFFAKSNEDVTLNCFYNGTISKDGESKQTLTPGDVIKISGDNKWKKYTLKLSGKLFSGGGEWDFSQPTIFNLGLDKQSLSENLELYMDDLELSESVFF